MHCAASRRCPKLLFMKHGSVSASSTFFGHCGFLFVLLAATLTACAAEEPTSAATVGFNAYVASLELRLARQHSAPDTFLAGTAASAASETRLRRGELIIENLTPSAPTGLPGALLHHWRGTAFIPGARAADFERLLKDFNHYPQIFAPQILRAAVLLQNQDHFRAMMRVRQRHILTVVMDTTYDVAFSQFDPGRGSSTSRSTSISEIDAPGTSAERALSPGQQHGFLWRLNTYWSWEERDNGLYIQIESVTLTRSIPVGLGWAIGPFIQSIPRESLEFTLRSASGALRNTSRRTAGIQRQNTPVERKPA